MPQKIAQSVENNFTKGLVTESTGLNFPENAATDADNCTFTIIGETKRRLGIDYEENGSLTQFPRISDQSTQCTYVWKNVGGDGVTQLVVAQLGASLVFYDISASDQTSPLSQHLLPTQLSLGSITSQGGVFDYASECQFSDGNGFLFVFHPSCDPGYVSFTGGIPTLNRITVQVRDFLGIPEPGTGVTSRPNSLSNEHLYNLTNQGWVQGSPWSGLSVGSGPAATIGSQVFTVQSGMTGVVNGQFVRVTTVNPTFPGGVFLPGGTEVMGGTVTSYVGTTLTINVTGIGNTNNIPGSSLGPYHIDPTNIGYINTWFAAEGNYPSNSDVWWYFKNASNVFDPATTVGNVTLNSGNAPQGHYILPAFNHQRTLVSGIAGLTDVTTSKRPRTGAWFAGRVWYTGIDASQAATGDAGFYSWTENLYFSQTVTTAQDFGHCFQINDPTSQTLFDLLPTDGGVLTIQGAGPVYKLFPIQNGMLVFAANGIWFITGSQGIGFSANDYTVTKISSVPILSSTSFVNVMGLPYFWNEDGIYQVSPQQGGGLTVNAVTIGTIETLYDAIPTSSKAYARGDYHPIDYTIQWVYKDTETTSVTDRYSFNRVLNYNVYNKAFYTYTVDNSNSSINSINYVAGPGGIDALPSGFKYWSSTFTSPITANYSFADEHDVSYTDWATTALPIDYTSYFVVGYKLRGGAIYKFQPQYVMMWRRSSGEPDGYTIQGIWDYASDPNSGRYTSKELVKQNVSYYGNRFKRHRIRGRGYALQYKISSLTGIPFNIIGWSIVDTVNTGT